MTDGVKTCPACGEAMAARPHRGVEIDQCSACRGIWFDTGELARAAKKALPTFVRSGPSARRCPTCAVPLVLGQLGPVEVDACATCRGAFLDAGESRQLMPDPVARTKRQEIEDERARAAERSAASRPLRRVRDGRVAVDILQSIFGS